MSFFKKIQERIIPIQTSTSAILLQPSEDIRHEFVNFSGTYRIGINCYYTDLIAQETISNYKKKLEHLGYECDVLIFIDKKENDHNVILQSFNWEDLDRKTMLPHSPRTDRFIAKKYDLLLNLFFKNCPPLHYLSHMSNARCRVGPYLDHFKHCTDVLIPIGHDESLDDLIHKINNTLNLKPYERKSI